ncbi:MAG: ATP-binding protein [Chloroflexota bacterium]|nr:ATP-binding protein [Chloroflexota bacterium]
MIKNTLLSEQAIKEFLRPLLFGVADADLAELARAAVVQSLPANTTICHEGERGNAVYAIAEGQVDILKRMDAKNERLLGQRGPGSFFGEMAILQDGTRTATVRTAQPTLLLKIDRESFLNVLNRSPSLAIRLLVPLADRLREADRKAITELRQANQELTHALQQLKQLDQAKGSFIQVAAHELRTPIAALSGYAQMIQNDLTAQESPFLRPLADGILTTTQRLQRIFNDILDVSKIINAKLQIHRNLWSMTVILKRVVETFSTAMAERRLTWQQTGIAALPPYPGDPKLLYKAFYHLVNNAIKYTPDGGVIKVRGQLTTDSQLGAALEITIEDNGIGIAKEDLELIFEKFYHIGEIAFHSSGTTKFKGGGAGLGLTIARGIIESHGGRIWAESHGYDEERCPGSRFIIRLPLSEKARRL